MKTKKGKRETPVIQLKDYVRYHEKLSKIIELASDLSDEIYGNLFDLACLNKWKEWSDEQPIGTIFEFTEDMLRNTGDNNIDILWELLDKIREVKNRVTKYPGGEMGNSIIAMDTTNIYISIKIAGKGTIIIDWGDDSPCETHTIYTYHRDKWWQKKYEFSHDYKCENPHGYVFKTIKITGENITHLSCFKCGLTSLEVSKSTTLTWLFCRHNQLTNLDLSKNILLTHLDCGDNKLTSLDVSKNTALTDLYCNSNQLTSLNVSQNIELTHLLCSENKLTNLDVSKNTEMKGLYCQNNQFSAAELDELFEILHDNIIDEKFIYVFDNPGTDACNKKIAEDKGWRTIIPKNS